MRKVIKEDQVNVEPIQGKNISRIKIIIVTIFLLAFAFMKISRNTSGILNALLPIVIMTLIVVSKFRLYNITNLNNTKENISIRDSLQKDGLDNEVDKIMERMESEANRGSEVQEDIILGQTSTNSKLSKSSQRRFTRLKNKKHVASHSVSLQRRSHSEKKYWFKPKSMGGGWTPSSREGWAVTLLFVGVIIGLSFVFSKELDSGSLPINFIISVILSVLLLIYIAHKKGEPKNLNSMRGRTSRDRKLRRHKRRH